MSRAWRATGRLHKIAPRPVPDSKEQALEERSTPAYVAEFIGTFFLVMFITTIVSVNSADGLGVTAFAVIGLVQAFVLAMLIYTLGGTSGGVGRPSSRRNSSRAARCPG